MSAFTCIDDESFAAHARAFAAIHVNHATQTLIPNLHVRVEMIPTAAGDLPVTLHDGRAGEAWICSPRTTYADCAGEESARYLPYWATRVSLRAITSMGKIMQWAGIDHAACINNWLLSTNLYPPLSRMDSAALLEHATQRWPRHTLWFRSLNEHDNADWLAALQKAGCQIVASRQVYLYDNLEAHIGRYRDLKRDLALLHKTPLRHCTDADITEADYPRIAQLYTWLYLGKYSRFNPLYSEEFLRRWHQAGLLSFEGFRDADGQLACVIGLFRQGRTITAPIVGYHTAQPQKMGLYRLATACAYRACIQHGWRLNFSAGAAGFKRLRGGIPAIEYSAVYVRHLPRRTRVAIAALSAATCRMGVPLLRKYQL